MSSPPDPLRDLLRIDGVSSGLESAGDAVAAVLGRRGRRRVTDAEIGSGLLSAARASAGLTEAPDRWFGPAIRLSSQLPHLARDRLAGPHVLARMHSLLARGVVPDDELGRVRDGVDADRLAGLVAVLDGARVAAGTIPSLLRAAIVHAELLALQPFSVGNDLVARAAEQLIVMASGSDPHCLVPLAQGHLALEAGYRHAFGAYQHGTPAGVGDWLRYCADAAIHAAELASGPT